MIGVLLLAVAGSAMAAGSKGARICTADGVFRAKRKCSAAETELTTGALAALLPPGPQGNPGMDGAPGAPGERGPSDIYTTGGANSIADFGTSPTTIASLTDLPADQSFLVVAKLRVNGGLTATAPGTVTCSVVTLPSGDQVDFAWVEMGTTAGTVVLATLSLQAAVAAGSGVTGVDLRCVADNQGANASVRASAFKLSAIATSALHLQ